MKAKPASPTELTPEQKQLADSIDAVLPQTQCQQCDYAGCRPYAEALACGQDTIEHCPPGGRCTLEKLAELTGQPITEAMLAEHPEAVPARHIVWIDPDVCIGCTKCIKVCPVDAILGNAKHMHQVLDQDCTGCDLCIPACPVDCIHIHPVDSLAEGVQVERDSLARQHTQERQQRLARLADDQRQAHRKRKLVSEDRKATQDERLAAIRAAVERRKAQAEKGS